MAAADQARCAGALLPLAALMSLLLLLSSLSVHAVSLQGRLRGESELRLAEAEDRLGSAAQLLVARIQQRHPCLLGLALEQWISAACLSGSALDPLLRGEVLGSRWQLLRWRPVIPADAAAGSGRSLSLEIGLMPAGREPAARAGFELRLNGPEGRVQELRPLGLRGELP